MNLLIYARDVVVGEGHVSIDIDKPTVVSRAALRLCPSGHSQHIEPVITLATCLQHRFQQRGAVTDLGDVIILHNEVLECGVLTVHHFCASWRGDISRTAGNITN